MQGVLLLTAMIAWQAGLPARQERRAAPAAPSTTALATVAEFDAKTAALLAKFAVLPNRGSVADNLAARVAIEQGLRIAMPDLGASGLSAEDRRAVNDAVWQRITPVDAQNSIYVKSVLPADGWFRKSRDGEQVARDAWLIVQHSPDQAFQRQVVASMAPLVQTGEAHGPDYALLYDRTELAAGRPQRYGSQMGCSNGQWTPSDLEEPENIDARRASVGLTPLGEYLKLFDGSC